MLLYCIVYWCYIIEKNEIDTSKYHDLINIVVGTLLLFPFFYQKTFGNVYPCQRCHLWNCVPMPSGSFIMYNKYLSVCIEEPYNSLLSPSDAKSQLSLLLTVLFWIQAFIADSTCSLVFSSKLYFCTKFPLYYINH